MLGICSVAGQWRLQGGCVPRFVSANETSCAGRLRGLGRGFQRYPNRLPARDKLIYRASANIAQRTRQPSEGCLKLWKEAEAVCLDVDSTLCVDESIDELADFLGVGKEVAEATTQAMQGDAKFEDSLRLRLGLMQPSADQVQHFVDTHPAQLSPGVEQMISELQHRGTHVFLVSGGFRAIIHPIARRLGVSTDHVYANTIFFKDNGNYAGFDESELTSRSGGKHAAAVAIKADHGCRTLVMIGDGTTDLEARQAGGADVFIGYGGAVERQKVAAAADWYVYSFQTLTDAL